MAKDQSFQSALLHAATVVASRLCKSKLVVVSFGGVGF
jgi:hypothetical protein